MIDVSLVARAYYLVIASSRSLSAYAFNEGSFFSASFRYEVAANLLPRRAATIACR